MSQYPIGTPGIPWDEAEKALWLSKQSVKRSYQNEVLDKLKVIPDSHHLVQYGELPCDPARYPLMAVVPVSFDPARPSILVTGGVHGYETSGVQGAIAFIQEELNALNQQCNIVVAPCVSPWGYETINRWNPDAIDPNRSFRDNSPSPEAAQLMAFVKNLPVELLMHIDLHETTNTDNSEFRPALAARDGIELSLWEIPDGFYLVADSQKVELGFQQAMIEAVKKVTHIAPSDANNKIIGAEVVSQGVICYDKKSLSLCAGMTNARYVTTTEVYPDSPNATDDICNKAQVAAILSGIHYALK